VIVVDHEVVTEGAVRGLVGFIKYPAITPEWDAHTTVVLVELTLATIGEVKIGPPRLFVQTRAPLWALKQ
jgi:hypothetical protein